MKSLTVFIITLFSISTVAQIQSKVMDAQTNEPIIYTNIWIDNQAIGTTTNEAGIFKFEALADTLTLVFSAVGYDTKRIKVSDLTPIIQLTPTAIELETITITAPNFRKERRTGKVRKKGIKFWFVASQTPWRIGKIFPYDSKYQTSPFLKSIDLCVKTHQNDKQFLIHILEVGQGTPDNWDVLEQNILHTVPKKGKTITTIDLSSYQIKIPKSGFMVVIEWLIVDHNRYEFEYTDTRTMKKKTGFRYEPYIGTVPTQTTENTWIYSRGKWSRDSRKQLTQLKKYHNKFTELAMELTLSD